MVPQVRVISERVQEQPEFISEKDKRTEFSVPSWQVSRIQFLLHAPASPPFIAPTTYISPYSLQYYSRECCLLPGSQWAGSHGL